MSRSIKTVSIAAVGLTLLGIVAMLRPEPPAITKEPQQSATPGADGCPPGSDTAGSGPEMVRVPEGFCIDTTEVTRAHYEAWLDSAPPTAGQPAACSDNADYTPTCSWPPAANALQPVVCVDWCDAHAFCAAAGKRLCGSIGDGTPYPFESYDDPTVSEWQAACTSGGKYAYAYGDDFNTDSCRDADADDYTTWGLADVGSFAACHSPDAPYAELFDLSGHVSEWDNSCTSDEADAGCRIRGGSYQHHTHGTRCAMGKDLAWPRSHTVDSVGFRCCAD